MNRSMWFWGGVVLAFVALAAGLLIPIHLRGVDAGVLARAGKGSPSLVDEGLGLTAGQGLGAAQLMLQAAQKEKLPDTGRLEQAVNKLTREHPDWATWGGADAYLGTQFTTRPSGTNLSPQHVTEIVIQSENRAAGLKSLTGSTSSAVHELLRCRALTNTVIFPPSVSASGQAFDAAIVTCGLLLTELHFTSGLSNAVYRFALNANQGHGTEPLEQVLLDMLALGQRF